MLGWRRHPSSADRVGRDYRPGECRLMRPLQDRVLALAGVVQAATLVDDTAHGQANDSESLQATLGSILKIESQDVPDVFGGIPGVVLGLKKLKELLGPERTSHDLSILRYSLSL